MEIKCPDCGKYYNAEKMNCPYCINKQKIESPIINKQTLQKPEENNQLKKCRSCSMMISKEAKVCPHCRKGQGISPNVAVVVIILFTIWIFYVGINSQTSSSSKNKQAITTPSTTKQNSSEFVVTWHSGIFWGLLVPENTTDQQLESLIYKFQEAKKSNYLSKIIPVTNPKIIDNENAQITILIFSEPEWASLDQNNKYIHTRGPDIIARLYLNHIRASYEYDCISSKKESGSIGYDEGGLRSVHLKELF
jgi:RNA polymerase subunit RPABC4/transcription elongation factor Spt4